MIEAAVISLLLFLIHIDCLSYRKNSDTKPWACICSKGFSAGVIFGGAYYWREFCVSKWVELGNKNSLKLTENNLKL